jgi:hypothetical protein
MDVESIAAKLISLGVVAASCLLVASGSHLAVVDASSAVKLIPELDSWLGAFMLQL